MKPNSVNEANGSIDAGANIVTIIFPIAQALNSHINKKNSVCSS